MKKIFIFSIMCLFAVFANAQYKVADPGWKAVKQFNILYYVDTRGNDDFCKAPAGEVYFTCTEENGETVCTVSLQIDEEHSVFDPAKVYRFKGAHFRIGNSGTIAIVDKFNKAICMWFDDGDKVFYIEQLVMFM